MRALRVLGLAEDGHNLVCEDGTSGELFTRAIGRTAAGRRPRRSEPPRPTADRAGTAAAARGRSRPGSGPARPSPRWPPRPTPASGASSATPTRCCWSGPRRPRRPGSRTRSSTATRPARTSKSWSLATLAERGQTPSVRGTPTATTTAGWSPLHWQAGRSENSATGRSTPAPGPPPCTPRTTPPAS